jgi:glycosyltransferase involved in cell wall biosynthesis
MLNYKKPMVSVVVIGRNEGARLLRCLNSVHCCVSEGFDLELIYVDSASTDGSTDIAAKCGAKVIEVRPERPSAALGRNAGWRIATGEYVLFLDGDTILQPEFISKAIREMQDPSVAVVWGQRRELDPGQSVYIRVLDLDWIYPPGPSTFCGGDALMRRDILERLGGYDDTLIAGEEPELCRRIRKLKFEIRHIDIPMTKHDLGILSLGAYWKRAFRAGYAYSELAERFKNSNDPLWLKDSRRNLLHGTFLLLSPLFLIAFMQSAELTVAMIVGGIFFLLRTSMRCAWKTSDRATLFLYSIHSHFQQIPIFFGQISHRLDSRRGFRRGLIEYTRDTQ